MNLLAKIGLYLSKCTEKQRLKNVEFYSKNKFGKFVHLVGFIIRLPSLLWTLFEELVWCAALSVDCEVPFVALFLHSNCPCTWCHLSSATVCIWLSDLPWRLAVTATRGATEVFQHRDSVLARAIYPFVLHCWGRRDRRLCYVNI